MTRNPNLVILGMYPWNFSSLNDTVRSMVRELMVEDFNVIYLNPQAEAKSFSMKWTERRESDLRIWNPPFSFLPTRYGVHRVREKLAARALQAELTRVLGADWMTKTTLYVTASTLELSYELVNELKPQSLIFDILDDNLGFPCLTKEKRAQLQTMFCEIANHATKITAVSHHLVEQTARLTARDVAYLPNGVDVEHFRNVPAGDEPDDLKHIPHPRVTFVGAITSWIDLPLVEQAAKALDDHQFVMIGPVMVKEVDLDVLQALQELPNVHFLGPKPYADVPRYLHASDVLHLPRTQDPFSLACDPLKVYEYLATGKPAVSTTHPSVERFAAFLPSSSDPERYVYAIRCAGQRNPEVAVKQQEIVDRLSWKVRAAELLARDVVHQS